MNIAPIRATRNYDRTLQRIEQLMDAKPGTKHGDELDVLTTLVEAYEAKHHVIYSPSPNTPQLPVFVAEVATSAE